MSGNETMTFNCTTCPSECELTVSIARGEDGAPRFQGVRGNRCPRGAAFAEREVTDPVRVLTTTVPVIGGEEPLVPVRSADALPLRLHAPAMAELRRVRADAPVRMGDVVVADILGSGVDIIASMDVA